MKKILFIDSGSGGVNILAYCVKNKICGDFLYFADLKESPYGDKSKEKICERVDEILKEVCNFFDFEIVVFACNTLTTSAIRFVRQKYPNITFVGTEPAVKPALMEFESKDVLIMATNRTLENLNMQGLCIPFLPSYIDANLLNLEVLERYVTSYLNDYKDKKAVVLGCTHYLAIDKIIQKNFPSFRIYDSKDGVMKRLKSFAGEGDCKVQFMSSGIEDNSIIIKYFHNLINIF